MKRIVEFFKSLWARLKGRMIIITSELKSDVLKALNDKELRALALQAIMDSVKSKFKDDEAWDNALDKFKSLLKDNGWELPINIIETILQLSYTVYKYKT